MSILKIDPSLLSTAGASDGQVLAYNASTNRIEFSAGGGGGGGGVTVYANNDVLPNTGVSVGSQAYVESTDRLYLWTVNNSWQRINSVNTPPTAITNYLGTYYLASNGAPTVLSLVSSDPELLPLTWSYEVANGTLGNTTVTQSANVFTVTPSTDPADEGSFTLTFSANDGVYATSANVIFNLSLQEGWNVANATLVGTANLFYRVATQESAPQTVRFSSNGLAMYVTGTSGDDINLYTLSAPWDLDSPTFVSAYTYTANATANYIGNPYSFQFSSDGSNLYVAAQYATAGATDRGIVQLSLATPYSLDSMNVTSEPIVVAFSVAAQEATPDELFFKSDGSRMYVVGATNDRIYEYHLSRSWDPSSATIVSNFLVSGKEATTQGMYFTPSGNAFYITGPTSDAVHRYDMSNAWSVNSAVFVSSFPVSNQESAPNAVEFKPDGSRMYVIGTSGDDFNEYSLSTPWDITTASFVQTQGQSQATLPSSMRFSSDGTNLYMTGTFYDVHYYTLSEAWNVATISFQYTWSPPYQTEGTVKGMAFSPEGDYLYLVGNTNDRVIPYQLRTPWDLNSFYIPGRYIDKNYFLGTTNMDFKLSPNGTKLYGVTTTSTAIIESTLNTAWDISTATVSNVFSISSDTTSLSGIDIDSTGNYIRTTDGALIYTYKMNSPWDLSTAIRPQTLNITETDPTDIFITVSGNTIFVVGDTLDSVQQYNLSTPWDLESASLANSFSVASQQANPESVTFTGDGTKMYIVGSNLYIYEYILSIGWDISTASYSKATSLGQLSDTNIQFIDFSANGSRLYLGVGNTYLDTYYLATPYDILSTYTVNRFYYDQIANISVLGLDFNADGSEAYLLATGGTIYKLYLSVPWDVGSSRYQRDSYTLLNATVSQLQFYGLEFSSDGKYLYTASAGRDSILRFEMLTPYKLATLQHPYITQIIGAPAEATYGSLNLEANNSLLFTLYLTEDNVYRLPTTISSNILTFSSSEGSWYRKSPVHTQLLSSIFQELKFKPDGTRLYALDSTGSLYEFELSTSWDISTLTLINTQLISVYEPTSAGFDISSDGRYLYIVGSNTDTVYQFKLSEPWSTKFIIFIGSYSVNAQESAPSSIILSVDGSYMYVMGTSGDDINQYTLSTPWDITTASFTKTQSISAQNITPVDLVFRPDGTRLYVRGTTLPHEINEYSLSTPWDVATLSYSRSLDLPVSWGLGGGIDINPSGTRLYVGDITNYMIREYVLGS
jgi:6-phosphogluconolactonase (cycloisomerase 2 family)